MADLESRLLALAADAEFPPTPDLAGAVRARVSTAPAPRVAWRRRRRALAVVIACALLLPAAAVAAVPGTRHAVLDWLGLRSVRVRTVPTVPAPPPAPPRSVPSAPRGSSGPLGRPATLAEARARLPFTVRAPARLGPPSRVYVAASPPGGRVSLVYAGRPRLLITEFRGSKTQVFLEKAVGPGTTVERVRVAGAPGAWIAGRPHGFVYADADGVIREESTRLAGNVLVWERSGLVFRLEGARTKATALAIARSLR